MMCLRCFHWDEGMIEGYCDCKHCRSFAKSFPDDKLQFDIKIRNKMR